MDYKSRIVILKEFYEYAIDEAQNYGWSPLNDEYLDPRDRERLEKSAKNADEQAKLFSRLLVLSEPQNKQRGAGR